MKKGCWKEHVVKKVPSALKKGEIWVVVGSSGLDGISAVFMQR